MAVPGRQPLRYQLTRAGQVDEYDAVGPQDLAIAPLQRRARDDSRSPGIGAFADPGGDPLQPRLAVLVVQRVSGGHLRDIGRRMQLVALLRSEEHTSELQSHLNL